MFIPRRSDMERKPVSHTTAQVSISAHGRETTVSGGPYPAHASSAVLTMPAGLAPGASARSRAPRGCFISPDARRVLSPPPWPAVGRWRSGQHPCQQRRAAVQALGSVAMPVVTEVAKRALAVTASGSVASNSVTTCAPLLFADVLHGAAHGACLPV